MIVGRFYVLPLSEELSQHAKYVLTERQMDSGTVDRKMFEGFPTKIGRLESNLLLHHYCSPMYCTNEQTLQNTDIHLWQLAMGIMNSSIDASSAELLLYNRSHYAPVMEIVMRGCLSLAAASVSSLLSTVFDGAPISATNTHAPRNPTSDT